MTDAETAETSDMKGNAANRVDCYKCKYFAITWESGRPMGCRLFGFKSRLLPSRVVLQSSGDGCMGFEEKELKRNGRRQGGHGEY